MSLHEINSNNIEDVHALLEGCCCAPAWIESMIAARPFINATALFNTSIHAFAQLTESDYLVAFAGHPQIGNLQSLHKKYASTSDSASHEQSGMSEAKKSLLETMQTLNTEYKNKFGFIFIVCASGKSAQSMLDLINCRINNDRQTELIIASNEQAKITQIRLEKLL